MGRMGGADGDIARRGTAGERGKIGRVMVVDGTAGLAPREIRCFLFFGRHVLTPGPVVPVLAVVLTADPGVVDDMCDWPRSGPYLVGEQGYT